MRHVISYASLFSLALLIAGCGSSSDSTQNTAAPGAGGSGGTSNGPGGGAGTAGNGQGGGSTAGAGGMTPTENLVGAPGISVKQVAVYQGVKRVLMNDGSPQSSDVPLVAGRDTMFRIFFNVDGSYDGQPVRVRFTFNDQEPMEIVGTPGNSVEEELSTTANYKIPGAQVGEEFKYKIEILQNKESAQANPKAVYPATGQETIKVDGKANKLRVVMVPFVYNTDGSGRTPNLQGAALDKIRNTFLGMYPVSDVEMSVRESVQWNKAILPNGQGWQEVGLQVSQLRTQDGVSDDVYYYGIFNPTASMNQFCSQGCLLGVTLLNNSPPSTGSSQLRLALGVGFENVAATTSAHEIGHSHGREHAPCGPFGQLPDQIDPQYPHQGGKIGTWGYDIVSGVLKSPSVDTDIMGYCDNQWVSDYTYKALFNRTQNVNKPDYHGKPTEYQIITLDGFGKPSWGPVITRELPLATNLGINVDVVSKDGSKQRVKGTYFRYDHLPGGWVLIPKQSDQAVSAEFNLDSKLNIATRK
jgi:hypothetical protein